MLSYPYEEMWDCSILFIASNVPCSHILKVASSVQHQEAMRQSVTLLTALKPNLEPAGA